MITITNLILLSLYSQSPCNHSTTIQVIDAIDQVALPEVEIKYGPVADKQDQTISTDENGQAKLQNICSEELYLTISHYNYFPQTYSINKENKAEIHEIELVVEDPETLEQVVVAAPTIAQDEQRTVSELDAKDLEQDRGENLADTVAKLPGVAVLRYGNTAKPIIRGHSGARVVVLYDGVRHEGQDWGLDHAPEIDTFTAGTLKVVKGSAGVKYGPDAIAGVLLVQPHELLMEPGLKAEAIAIGAYNGLKRTLALRLDGANNLEKLYLGTLSWRLEGNYSQGAGLTTPDYPLDNTAITEWNLGGTLQTNHSNWSLKLSFHHNEVKNGLCLCIRNETPDDFRNQLDRNRPINVELYRVDEEIERPYQQVTHDKLISRLKVYFPEIGEISLTYAFQLNLRQEFDIVRRATTGPQFDFTLRTHTADIIFQHDSIYLGDAELTGELGFSGMYQENIFTGLPLIPNYKSNTGGVFIRESLSLGIWSIETGIRYDISTRDTFIDENSYTRHINRGTINEGDCTERPEAAQCVTDFEALSYSLGGLLRLESGLLAKLHLSTASRFPTIDEQYINGTAPSFPVLAVGSPSLEEETSWSLTGSLKYENNWLITELSLFGSYIQDYIYFAPELNANGTPVLDVLIRGTFPRFSYRPIDALFYGAEFYGSASYRAVAVAFQTSIIRAQDTNNNQSLVLIPPDRLSGEIKYTLPDLGAITNNFVSVDGTYVAKQSNYEPTADLAPPPDAYFLLGLSMGTEINTEKQRYRLSIEADNLLNTRYRDYTSLLRYYADEPGFQFFVRLGAEVNI